MEIFFSHLSTHSLNQPPFAYSLVTGFAFRDPFPAPVVFALVFFEALDFHTQQAQMSSD